jgi:hypothetical protein
MDASITDYLKSRKLPIAVLLMLSFGLLYQSITGMGIRDAPVAYLRYSFYGLLLVLALLVFRSPRWAIYSAITLVLIIHLYFYTQIISKLDHDAASTRDNAVEMTTKAFLRGENPWNHVSELGVPATTGPASILLAIPFLLIFGEINWLAFLFWILVFLILFSGEFRERNSAFPFLSLLFLTGLFGFTHTLYWSLEELYFGYIFIPLAFWSVNQQRLFLAGALLAIAVLIRLNYVFVVLAFLLWYISTSSFKPINLLKLGLGAVIASLAVLVPFILVGGKEFWAHNPFISALSMSGSETWPSNNIFFRGLNFLGRNLDQWSMRIIKLGIISGSILIAAILLKNIQHPFWTITVAAFLTQTVAWFSRLPADYVLMIVLPAFIAIAFTSRKYLLYNELF